MTATTYNLTYLHQNGISPVGDDQEKYYEQKYLLNVCLTDEGVLGCWLDNTTNPTWEAAAEAPYLMDAHTVAHSIQRYINICLVAIGNENYSVN